MVLRHSACITSCPCSISCVLPITGPCLTGRAPTLRAAYYKPFARRVVAPSIRLFVEHSLTCASDRSTMVVGLGVGVFATYTGPGRYLQGWVPSDLKAIPQKHFGQYSG